MKRDKDHAGSGSIFTDGLIRLKFNNSTTDTQKILNSFNTFKELEDNNLIAMSNSSSEYQPWVEIIAHSNFFLKILKDGSWCDIESTYFEDLLRISTAIKKYPEDDRYIDEIRELNKGFEILTKELYTYLDNINSEMVKGFTPNESIKSLIRKCNSQPDKEYYNNYFKSKLDLLKDNNSPLNHTWYLNFNYTSLFEKYLDDREVNKNDEKRFKTDRLINIHGKIGSSSEDIIFGYGDESHPRYSELEQLNKNEVLVNIKSFKYSFQPDYLELMSFLESDKFEVYCLGHSFGLSDRILLKGIFENERCKSIRVFHRGKRDSFFKKVISLSRHFENKLKFRNKLLNFNAEDILSTKEIENIA
jgi:hypothetical protein